MGIHAVCSLKVFIWSFLVACFLLTACLPSNDALSDIKHYRIGQHDLYIPYAYVRFGYTSVGVGGDSGLIQAYYPGGAPVLEDTNVLFRRGLWYKNVRILFTDLAKYPSFNLEKVLQKNIELYGATTSVGDQYGLMYQTQPPSTEHTWPNELWIEKDRHASVSFISCREKYADGVVPQCTHHFYDDRFWYQISYDKQLLQEWRLIRENVLALMASFESEETARAFIVEQIPKTIPMQKGESP